MKKALGFFSLILWTSTAWATPANTPILDGRPIEYDSTDLRATFGGTPTWTTVTVSNLFVTWDATNLYIGYQAWLQSDKLAVIIDADPDAGTGATTTTNWIGYADDFPGFIKFNDFGWEDNSGAFGLDYMLASEGNYNNILRVLYDGTGFVDTNDIVALFDIGNRNTPTGGTLDMACERNTTLCPHQGLEAKIPWSVFYGASNRFGTIETGKIIPRGAKIRILAGVHNNTPNNVYSSPDTLPRQTGATWANGLLTNPEYMDVLFDVDTNGIPDLLSGDLNAPWIRAASGAVGGTNLYVAFSEPVIKDTVENTANWTVGGVSPITAVAQNSHIVLLGLATPIASANLLLIQATGVQDASLNSRLVEHCLFPAASGIPLPVTVTFQVNTNSGMGISSSHAKPNAFFVNGGSLPLEWSYSGYPPFETTSLTPIPGSNGWASASVTFLAGSPTELFYKYSSRISGNNNYEAIRLADFTSVSRKLTLNTNGSPMTVREYLGAAAHPLRNPSDTNQPSAHNRLYTDPCRGDAGIRVRREILFQLDLSLRKRDNLQRVMVMGSDPLRGFNDTGAARDFKAQDFPKPGENLVPWNEAGIQLFDDGTHGDTIAADGVYARIWTFSTDGFDSVIEPGSPNSLVGGVESLFFPEDIPGTQPYDGTGWLTRRSPRSFIYKYYVLTDAENHYESPSSNIEYYVADPDETSQIVLASFLWDNESIPPPPASNAPALTGVTLTGTTATVQFENVLTEGSHGVLISTNLINGFGDYGLRATRLSTNGGIAQWSAGISQISTVKEYYAPYAGLEPDPRPNYWEPSFIPATATVVRVHFSQYKTSLKGGRTLAITGPFAGWGDGIPMTFLGNGHWFADVALPAGTENVFEYKFRNGGTWLDIDGNLKAIRGGAGATWTPDQPTPDELFTVTFDTTGTPIAGATNVKVHLGYPPGAWSDRLMTNTTGSIWEYSTVVPTNASINVSWVFNAQTNGSSSTNWYSPTDWKAFISPFVNP